MLKTKPPTAPKTDADTETRNKAEAHAACNTFPKLLLHNAAHLPNRPAMREKEFGIWQTWTWQQMKQEIFAFAAGLHALGFKREDKLAIIGRNRPHLYWGLPAAQILRGIPVPIYHDSAAAEVEYVLNHADARFILAEDQEQVDKILEIAANLPHKLQIIYADPRGLQNYPQKNLHHLSALQTRARESLQKQGSDSIANLLDARIKESNGDDTAIFLYTSGTTGNPKGVVLSNDNVLITSRNSVTFDNLTSEDEVLAYLPMAWVGDNLFSYAQAYVAGFCINCPESEHTVALDLREIGPTYYFAPPRIFEDLLTSVMIRMEDASALKRKIFHYFLNLARTRDLGTRILNGQPTTWLERFQYALGDLLIYAPLKNTMGFSRIRLAYTAGEAVGVELFNFYRSLGINIKQLYGQTEAVVFITMHPQNEVYAETVGKPAPQVEVDISTDGEVLYRGPGVFQGYHKNEQATRETKNAQGWVKTGDAGYFDDIGHLRIIDRAKDVGKLNNGAIFAPKYLENKLKFFPHIREAVTFGHQRDYVTAMLNIDLDATGNWAERNSLPYASYQELAAHPKVYDLIQDSIQAVNRDLARDSKLRASQIKRFLILHKELDPDDGEMTRTRKVRRNAIAQKYQPVIDALYSTRNNCHIQTEVTFEDGRRGTLAADLQIREPKTFAHAPDAQTPTKKAA